MQEQIAVLFIELIAEKRPKHFEYLSQIHEISLSRMDHKEAQYEELFATMMASEAPTFVEEVMQLEAKIVDMQFRARTSAGITCLDALYTRSSQSLQKIVKTGDTFYEVIGRCAHAGLHRSLVQELVNTTVLWPSLTTHPTNPTSVEYTRVALNVQNLVSSQFTTRQQLSEALQAVIETEMDEPLAKNGSRKKSPHAEIQEVLLILDGIYNSVHQPAGRLREALDAHGYEAVNTKNATLLDLNIWCVGDGDGNPNMDAKILHECVIELKSRIRQRYKSELEDIAEANADNFPLLKEKILAFISPKDWSLTKALLKEWVAEHSRAVGLHELYTRFKIFQNNFCCIDVRHNSVDIVRTICAVFVKTNQLETIEQFYSLPEEKQYAILSRKLNDKDFTQLCAQLDESTLAGNHFAGDHANLSAKDGELAWRLLSRVRVMAKYPDMFRKFIIAETRTTIDVLGALLLLQMGGCEVATPKTLIDIVPLFESREDLINAPFVVHTLASEGLFAAHLQQRGHFLVMIAKSDTARLSGPGVQGQQEATYGKLLSMNGRTYGGIQMNVMLGGGDDQMRGGGRIVESPHVILRAAAREGGRNPTKTAMTIQGQQMQLVFGTIASTAHFIEAFCSQALLANARIQGLLPWRQVPVHLNEISAERQAMDFFNRTMNNYEVQIGYYDPLTKLPSENRRTIVDYFQGFPSVIIDLTNKSSRPGSRVKTIDPLEGRAISLDQRSKHDGSYLTATVGVADALEYLLSMLRTGGPDELSTPPYQPMTSIRHCFLANKSFRDFVRMQATILHHKDYRNAWKLRGGVPTEEERRDLLQRYRENGYNPPRVFLAKLEERDHREAALLYHAITGNSIVEFCQLKLPLEAGWPGVASQMHTREEQSKFSKVVERIAAEKIAIATQSQIESDKNKIGATPEHLEWLKRIAYYSYVGANPALTTPSFSMTMTDPYKEGKTKLDQLLDIPMPLWIDIAQIAATPDVQQRAKL